MDQKFQNVDHLESLKEAFTLVDTKQKIYEALFAKELYITDSFIDIVLKYLPVEDVLSVIQTYTGQKMISVREFLEWATECGDVADFDSDESLVTSFIIPEKQRAHYIGHVIFTDDEKTFLKNLIDYISTETHYITNKGRISLCYDVDKLWNVLFQIQGPLHHYLVEIFSHKQTLMIIEYF